MTKTYITWEQVYHKLEEVTKGFSKDTKYYGVPRGGQIIAGMTSRAVDKIEDADVIIDDLIDSGATYERYKKYKESGLFSLGKQKKEIQKKQLKIMSQDCYSISERT